VFSSTKMAIFWILFVAVIGLGIFKGKGMRLAVWIPQSRKQMSWRGSMMRWTVVLVGILLIWQGWRLTMRTAVDVVMIGVGSFMEIAGLYILGTKVGQE
jgi:hypothetical protein